MMVSQQFLLPVELVLAQLKVQKPAKTVKWSIVVPLVLLLTRNATDSITTAMVK